MLPIAVSYNITGVREVVNDLKKMEKDLAPENLQVYRAKKFKKYTKNLVKTGMAGLKPISSATRILAGEHDPMWIRGNLLDHMKIEKVKGTKGKAADVGYFGASTMVPKKDITWNQLAVLQHTGFRIPLTGEKGRRVRAWLAMNGVNLFGGVGYQKNKSDMWKQDRKWIHVPPRPFMFHSVERYVRDDMDSKAVMEYLDGLKGRQSVSGT